jgi:hypothetical protein
LLGFGEARGVAIGKRREFAGPPFSMRCAVIFPSASKSFPKPARFQKDGRFVKALIILKSASGI